MIVVFSTKLKYSMWMQQRQLIDISNSFQDSKSFSYLKTYAREC